MWPGGHIEKFSERLTDCLLVGLNLAGATVPPLDCQAFKAPLSPGGALLWSRPRGSWLAEPNVLKSDFDTLVGLEAGAVTESETEAERLRAQRSPFP